MSFFRGKQGREQISTTGMDDKDFVMAGIKFNVVFLGSMLVPTPTGHGSSRTESAVDKIYHEKYKAFGYGSRKVFLEISDEEIKVFENSAGKDIVSVANFPILNITYCNLDMKHEKAFVFVVADPSLRSYRAHVFHCDSATKVREILTKFRDAFTLKGNKIEATRLRSFSAPERQPRQTYPETNVAINYTSEQQQKQERQNFRTDETDWGSFEESKPKNSNAQNQRQRSQTDLLSEKNAIVTQDFENQQQAKCKSILEYEVNQESFKNGGALRNDSGEDEFTILAEKRLRSFDDQAKSGTGEGFLLLNSTITNPSQENVSVGNLVSLPQASKPERENLLEF